MLIDGDINNDINLITTLLQVKMTGRPMALSVYLISGLIPQPLPSRLSHFYNLIILPLRLLSGND